VYQIYFTEFVGILFNSKLVHYGHISVNNYSCIIILNILVESSCNTLSHKTKISLSKIWDLRLVLCCGGSHIISLSHIPDIITKGMSLITILVSLKTIDSVKCAFK
jgi:hypothetical protein